MEGNESWPSLKYYIKLCLEGLKKTMFSMSNCGSEHEFRAPFTSVRNSSII
jgi:hypothetical protein